MSPNKEPAIILASSSPRRKKLLQQYGLSFKVDPSSINEDIADHNTGPKIAEKLAVMKAEDVATRYQEALIIAADTIVVYRHKILGKPGDLEAAKRMLADLRGREHEVYTGIALLRKKAGENNKLISKLDGTKVKMRNFSNEELRGYLASREPLGKAGAYAIQGLGSLLVKSISGSYFTVMGLPVHLLPELLGEFSISIL